MEDLQDVFLFHSVNFLIKKIFILDAQVKELIWWKTRTTLNFNIYYDSCKALEKNSF